MTQHSNLNKVGERQMVRGAKRGEREKKELSGSGPGLNYKNNMTYIDSESLHMVLCFFVQINKRRMRWGVCILQLDSYLCGTSKGGCGITNQPVLISPRHLCASAVGCWLPEQPSWRDPGLLHPGNATTLE